MEKQKSIIIPILISCLVVIIFVITLVFNVPRIKYKYYEDIDGYLISSVYGNKDHYIIDESYKGKPILGIDERAFYKKNLISIEFENPSNLKYINRLAFSECKNLKTIDLSYTINIERNSFSYCNKLNNLYVSSKNIGASCFYKCINLDNITLINTENLGSLTFSYTNIKELELPITLSFVGIDAFKYCDSLQSIIYHNEELKSNEYITTLSIAKYM